MTPDHYRRVSSIFQQAFELEEADRDAFLEIECAGDAGLRQEVEELLAHDDEGELLDDKTAAAMPPVVQPREEFSGRVLGRYRIMEKLGEGGMASVYRAEDTKLKRPVALKFLAPDMLLDSAARARFLREAQAAAALDHPNICTVYEMDEVEGHSFIVMALLEGRTLADRLAEGPLKTSEVVEIALQAARGLEAAHSKRVVHRDIKPANLMLLKSGGVKIMDFGVARVADDRTLTQDGLTVGTLSYMSPEQIMGARVDGRTDVWALGVVLYEALAGSSPFMRSTVWEVVGAITDAKPPPLAEKRGDLPDGLAAFVERALNKDIDKRYQSGELCAELQEISDQIRTDVRAAADGAAPPRSAGRFRWAVILAAAAITTLLLAWAFVASKQAGT